MLVTGGLMYLQLWYYTPPAMQDHLYYLAHPAAALERTGSDSIDRGLLGLARWSGLKVVDPNAFVQAHSEFFVYGAGSGWLVEWLKRRLCAHRASRRRIGGRDPEVVRPVR